MLAFDRGARSVQKLAELKSLRDSIVHPKVRTIRYVEDANPSGAQRVMVDLFGGQVYRAESKETAILKVPAFSSQRTSHAIKALVAVNEFFNCFFSNWCGMDSDLVCDILLGEHNDGVRATYSLDVVGGLTRAMEEWGLDLSYLGLQK